MSAAAATEATFYGNLWPTIGDVTTSAHSVTPEMQQWVLQASSAGLRANCPVRIAVRHLPASYFVPPGTGPVGYEGPVGPGGDRFRYPAGSLTMEIRMRLRTLPRLARLLAHHLSSLQTTPGGDGKSYATFAIEEHEIESKETRKWGLYKRDAELFEEARRLVTKLRHCALGEIEVAQFGAVIGEEKPAASITPDDPINADLVEWRAYDSRCSAPIVIRDREVVEKRPGGEWTLTVTLLNTDLLRNADALIGALKHFQHAHDLESGPANAAACPGCSGCVRPWLY